MQRRHKETSPSKSSTNGTVSALTSRVALMHCLHKMRQFLSVMEILKDYLKRHYHLQQQHVACHLQPPPPRRPNIQSRCSSRYVSTVVCDMMRPMKTGRVKLINVDNKVGL